jgi:hypothetical protein
VTTPSRVETIVFPDGAPARIVHTSRATAAGELVRLLDLPATPGVVVLNGGTEEQDGTQEQRLRSALAELAGVVSKPGLTVVTGGTDAGVFALLGESLGDGTLVRCIGVAPEALVTWPGREDAAADAVPLEPHHSDFVLVDGGRWGDETGTMMSLTAAIAAGGPSLAILAGGGEVAATELLAHVRAGRRVVVLAGTGRLADAVAAAVEAGGSRDPQLREAVASGRVSVVDTSRPEALGRLVRSSMRRRRLQRPSAPALLKRFPLWYRRPTDHPFVLAGARAAAPSLHDELAYLDESVVPRFRELEHSALRAQHSFRLAGVLLIVGSATAASLGAAQTAIGGGSLPVGIAEGVVAAFVSGMLVYTRGRRFQQRYLTSRVAAERMKSQYFLFLARAGIYETGTDRQRRDALGRALDRIEGGEDPG